MEDRQIVERQIGRAPRAFRRVAVRCTHGRPAVTEQAPYDRDGNPFPTTYYVTCRHLQAAVSRIEAAGGVERMSALLARDEAIRADHARATLEQQRVRLELAGTERGRDGGASLGTGIGGSRNPAQLKCLHAHVAYALARPGYLLGERILEELKAADGIFPSERCCFDQGLST